MISKKSVKISAVGDISFGDHLLCLGYGVRSTIEGKGNNYIFSHVKDYFKDSDIIFGNMETVLSDKGLIDGNIESIVLRGGPEAITTLNNAGFNILNLANNHALQHGIGAFQETNELLKKNSISTVGIASYKKYSSIPIVKEIKGIKIGFLGYSFVEEDNYKGEPAYAIGRIDNITSDIIRLHKQVEFVVVSCHWGLELIDRPSIETIKTARTIVDSGADIILGHHPHVFQGIERYKHAIIFYSLGNFVFDLLWWKPSLETAIVEITLSKNKPIVYNINAMRINKNYQPVPLFDKEAERFASYLQIVTDKLINEAANFTDKTNLTYDSELARLERMLRFKKLIYLICHLHKQKLSHVNYIMKTKLRDFIRK